MTSLFYNFLNAIEDPELRIQLQKQCTLDHEQLLLVLDTIDEIVFVQVPETSEIVFVNETGRKRYGNKGSLQWEKISHSFRDMVSMMTSLYPEKPEFRGLSEWEALNRMDQRWYRCREIPVTWVDGRRVVCLFALDITELKQLRVDFAHCRERFEKTTFGTVQAMGKMVEMRDPYTAGHQKRVAQLTSLITREMGLSEDEIDCCFLSSLVHDIGKVSIPTEILLKPGRLTDIEYSIIQVHPQVGFDILQPVEFPWPVASIVLQHHERINGSGYPKGLRGESILFSARIIAVADTMEAMLSRRSFRHQHDFREVIREIWQNRDILFDRHVVDACLKTISENTIKALWHTN